MGSCTAKISFYQSIVLIVGLICLQLSIPAPGNGFQQTDIKGAKSIVLDPGHGGENHGAKGIHGTLEKEISLTLAKRIKARLINHYHVLLTRDNDHDLPLSDRTALANHHKAALFISIHTGGAALREPNASNIMYYRHPQAEMSGMESNMAEMHNNQDSAVVKWDKIQLDHVAVSRTMADTLRAELSGKLNSISPVVSSAPLYVLSGAAMPALYIEPFYLTNPEAEKWFQTAENIEQLAIDIAAGIAAVLEKQGP